MGALWLALSYRHTGEARYLAAAVFLALAKLDGNGDNDVCRDTAMKILITLESTYL
jgi:hypothetical protein